MSDAPRPPPKRDVALALLEESSMFIHLDPRRPDVIVPRGFLSQHQLVLQVGLNMAIPIPDLKVDEAGVSCTLSFNRSPFWCRIPWSAIYALVGDDGRGGVWPEDVPPEIQQQKQGAAQKPAGTKRGKPKLSAVGSREETPAEGPRSRSGGAVKSAPGRPADDKLEDKPKEPRRIGLAAAPPPREAEETATASGEGRPDAGDERQPNDAAGAEVSEIARPKPSAPGGSGAKKPKREIPPYLRVIK